MIVNGNNTIIEERLPGNHCPKCRVGFLFGDGEGNVYCTNCNHSRVDRRKDTPLWSKVKQSWN
jgi:uncharacterized Zn finger protein (UPF0148 family)